MTNYTKSTNFASKDSLPTGNALKIVKGTEIDTEFNNIVSAVATKADSTSPTFTGTPTAPTATAGNNSTQVATTAYADAAAASTNYLDTTRIDVASATTVNLTTSAPNTRHINITGTTIITGFTVAAGKTYFVRFNGALVLTNSSTLVTQTGRNITTVAGDTCILRATAADTIEILDYSPVTPEKQLQDISASVASNALTATFNPTRLEFRSTTITNGTSVTRYLASAASVVIPSGATLGTTNAVQNRLTVLAIDNAGTIELAIINTGGTVFLDESVLINTTAITTDADSLNVAYSTSSRTGVAFRIVGYITSTQATAGTWASAPSNVSSYFATTAMVYATANTLGFGQTWTDVKTTPGRVSGTTYTNSTGKPIMVSIHCYNDFIFYINSTQVAAWNIGQPTAQCSGSFIIPNGSTYSIATGYGLLSWWELR